MSFFAVFFFYRKPLQGLLRGHALPVDQLDARLLRQHSVRDSSTRPATSLHISVQAHSVSTIVTGKHMVLNILWSHDKLTPPTCPPMFGSGIALSP